MALTSASASVSPFPTLQPQALRVGQHLPSTPDTVIWGRLPTEQETPVFSVRPGDVFTVDTVSHEGILEDQGRNPDQFFAAFGVQRSAVLDDARAIAQSAVLHDSDNDGPHVVTGPVAVAGARPGDVLVVRVLDLTPRASYGIISARHGFGALPGEMPEGGSPVSVFASAGLVDGKPYGNIAVNAAAPAGASLRFPLRPFLGLMGVATEGTDRLHSVPPGRHGGNLDVAVLGVGATLYLPVLVDEALFYVGDPHFSQGDGEVALTAFEAPLRATLQLNVLPQAAAPSLPLPYGETPELYVPIGLHVDLDEAMRICVRNSLHVLEQLHGIDKHVGMAYLSAAADFSVSQVVDQVKGIHAKIRKRDLLDVVSAQSDSTVASSG
jgi:acetamidase/formamidase